MLPFQRPDYREPNQLRNITFQPDIAPYAGGSVLVSYDNTKVICAATLEKKLPKWMIQQNVTGGWITAEYSMLPYSTLERKTRDISKGKVDGRTVEIQRLIGRAIRAVADLSKMDGYTLWIDCDVLQADGGTRTASITGAYVAAEMAIRKAIGLGALSENPLTDTVAAASVGIFQETAILDLNYIEDKDAEVDCNVVMTGKGKFVEIQSSGEENTFTEDQFAKMIKLAKDGISLITKKQNDFLK